MGHVKFRRWGPYVWWICPSRKCLFENKTDLSFVKGEYQTKCQYCNTPITIKLNAGQLELEFIGVEEEEGKPSPAQAAPKTPAATLTPQAPSSPAPLPATSPAASDKQSTSAPSPSSATPTSDASAAKQMEPPASRDSGASKSSKEPKKKAAS